MVYSDGIIYTTTYSTPTFAIMDICVSNQCNEKDQVTITEPELVYFVTEKARAKKIKKEQDGVDEMEEMK